MLSKDKRLFLETYGLSRMILGTAQLAALSAGYFLMEFVVRYPERVIVNVFNQDILALMCLAVFLRAMFHILCGVGISRIRLWGRLCILWGWPVMGLITLSVFSALTQEFTAQGAVFSGLEIIHWPKLGLYLLIIFLDMFVVSSWIMEINMENKVLEKIDPPMGAKSILIVFFCTVAAVTMLLFVASPVKQGFYKGFYKLKGERPAQKKLVSTQTPVPLTKKESRQEAASQSAVAPKPQTAVEKSEGALIVKEENQPLVDSFKKEARVEQTIAVAKPHEVRRGTPYLALTGYFGGLLIVVGFLLQWIGFTDEELQGTVQYVLFLLGFILWVVYSLGLQLLPLTLTSVTVSAICIGLLFLKFKS